MLFAPEHEGAARLPAESRSATIFFTGLSGAGKSTIAAALCERLRALGRADVVLLDGDAVRNTLTPRLGFSKADRDRNIERLALLARGVMIQGGIAVCAAIAPYDGARRLARRAIEAHGLFLLVHVSTPLAVCEQRDPKGLYARARTGELRSFTGVSDPYEAPADADVTIDTTALHPAAAVARIVSSISPVL